MQQSEATSQNGKPPGGFLRDHLELASLEWKFEKQEAWRRLLILGVGAMLLMSSFVCLQIAIFSWLLRLGFRWDAAGLALGILYFVAGVSTIWFFGKRHKDLGAPFEGSLSELKRSFNWIEKHFF